MTEVIFIAIGGFFGAIARYFIGKKFNNQMLPFGTLMVNLLGAFLLGILAGMQVRGPIYSLLGVGFMGAFTTFSTFMLEGEQLRLKQQYQKIYIYLAVTVVLGIMLAYIGVCLGKSI